IQRQTGDGHRLVHTLVLVAEGAHGGAGVQRRAVAVAGEEVGRRAAGSEAGGGGVVVVPAGGRDPRDRERQGRDGRRGRLLRAGYSLLDALPIFIQRQTGDGHRLVHTLVLVAEGAHGGAGVQRRAVAVAGEEVGRGAGRMDGGVG